MDAVDFFLTRYSEVHTGLVDGERRRADVKGRTGWTSLDLPRPISAAKRRAFLKLLGARYREW